MACFTRLFPRLASVTCFPALSIGYLFSRARHIGNIVSLALHALLVFLRLVHVTCFPALGTRYTYFPALDIVGGILFLPVLTAFYVICVFRDGSEDLGSTTSHGDTL